MSACDSQMSLYEHASADSIEERQGCAPFHLPRDAKTLPLLLRTYGSGYCLQEVTASGPVYVNHLPISS